MGKKRKLNQPVFQLCSNMVPMENTVAHWQLTPYLNALEKLLCISHIQSVKTLLWVFVCLQTSLWFHFFCMGTTFQIAQKQKVGKGQILPRGFEHLTLKSSGWCLWEITLQFLRPEANAEKQNKLDVDTAHGKGVTANTATTAEKLKMPQCNLMKSDCRYRQPCLLEEAHSNTAQL